MGQLAILPVSVVVLGLLWLGIMRRSDAALS